ncbi:MAG: hypothetical protein R3315_04810 [Woeseiaceae bacterium]|nr:hypothetical protein [Woeseiaceae bacterium]
MPDPATNEWLDLMLEEIERRVAEAEAAREEAARRRSAAQGSRGESDAAGYSAAEST